jgi:hypothetical protein
MDNPMKQREAEEILRAAGGEFSAPPPKTPQEKRPLHRELPPPEPYPIEALGPLADAAKAVATLTQAPPAMAAQSVLAAATLAAQAHADVKLPHGAVRPLSAFFLTIAGSGERKTTCDGLALRGVYEVEELWRGEYETAMQDYRRDLAAFKEATEHAKRGAKTKGRAAIKEALAAVGDEPREPPRAVLLVNDLTPDGLALHLEKSRPWAGIFSAEGGGFMGGHAMNDDNRMRMGAMLNSAWDGEPIKRARVLTGFSYLPGRRISCHLMMQGAVAGKLLGDPMLADMGLLARCLTVQPESTIGGRMFQEPDRRAQVLLGDYTHRLSSMLQSAPKTRAGDDRILDPPAIECDPEARALWIAFSNEIENTMKDGNPLAPIRAFACKLGEHAARLAGVLTVYQARDLKPESIGGSAMANGITLARHYASEALRLHGVASVAPDLVLAGRLLAWWRGLPDRRLHLAKIYQFVPVEAIRDAATARRIAKILETEGHAIPLPPGTIVEGVARREAWELTLD